MAWRRQGCCKSPRVTSSASDRLRTRRLASSGGPLPIIIIIKHPNSTCAYLDALATATFVSGSPVTALLGRPQRVADGTCRCLVGRGAAMPIDSIMSVRSGGVRPRTPALGRYARVGRALPRSLERPDIARPLPSLKQQDTVHPVEHLQNRHGPSW